MLWMWLLLIGLAGLGVLAAAVYLMPEGVKQRQKKARKPAPVPPSRDWQALAEKFERRVHALEALVQKEQAAVRDKDKEALELRGAIKGFEKQLQQERSWREKEESVLQKEKKREKALEEDLRQTRAALDAESTTRIRQDHELKELTAAKEGFSTDARRFSTKCLEQERQLALLTKENRELKDSNVRLQQKKEADQWVAKDDHVALEKQLRQARRELELLKKAPTAPAVPPPEEPLQSTGA
jgi:hypothetical protein